MTIAKHLLLVEDNPDDADLTVSAFRRNRIDTDIHIARDGAEALDWLIGSEDAGPQAPAPPAVVLLDLKLPKIDGLDVLQRIRRDERTRLLPVVILSSSDEEADLVDGYRLGANSYVRKPVDFAALVDTTSQIGRYWLTLNEAPPLR